VRVDPSEALTVAAIIDFDRALVSLAMNRGYCRRDPRPQLLARDANIVRHEL
jgi:hypothetical protein